MALTQFGGHSFGYTSVFILCGGALLVKCTESMRKMPCYTSHLEAEKLEEVEDESEEGEDEALAFIFSGVIFRWFEHVIELQIGCKETKIDLLVGKSHEVQNCDGAHMAEYLGLIMVALMIVLLVVSNSLLFTNFNKRTLKHRAMRTLKTFIGMLVSRVLLGMVMRYLDARISLETVAELLTALTVTVFAIMLTFTFDLIADRLEERIMERALKQELDETRSRTSAAIDEDSDGSSQSAEQIMCGQSDGRLTEQQIVEHLSSSTRGLVGVFGLLVGLAWEEVFVMGNETLVAEIDLVMRQSHITQLSHKVILQTFLTFLVLLVMLPGWAKYIVPYAAKGKNFHEKIINDEQISAPKMFNRDTLSMLFSRCCGCCGGFSAKVARRG
jgi:ABC-type multidrug transport system fused ATPase/permease subunit